MPVKNEDVEVSDTRVCRACWKELFQFDKVESASTLLKDFRFLFFYNFRDANLKIVGVKVKFSSQIFRFSWLILNNSANRIAADLDDGSISWERLSESVGGSKGSA